MARRRFGRCSDEVAINCPVDECDGRLLATVTPEELSDLVDVADGAVEFCGHAQQVWDDRGLFQTAWDRAANAAHEREEMLYDDEMERRISRRLGK